MKKITLGLGADHAGYILKNQIKKYLENNYPDIQIIDFGTNTEKSVDYPHYAYKVSKALIHNEITQGILVCGTGIGMSIAANKYHSSIKAALCHDETSAKRARSHNNANILCLGAIFVTPELASEIINTWIKAEFSHGERHLRRLDIINQLKKEL